MPDFPEKTRILSPADKAHLLEKLQQDKGNQKVDYQSVNWVKVIGDYKIWLP